MERGTLWEGVIKMDENKFVEIQKRVTKIIQKNNVTDPAIKFILLNSTYGTGIEKDVLDDLRKKDEDDTVNRKINHEYCDIR